MLLGGQSVPNAFSAFCIDFLKQPLQEMSTGKMDGFGRDRWMAGLILFASLVEHACVIITSSVSTG